MLSMLLRDRIEYQLMSQLGVISSWRALLRAMRSLYMLPDSFSHLHYLHHQKRNLSVCKFRSVLSA